MSKYSSQAITHLNRLSIGAGEERSYKILFGLLSTALKNGSTTYLATAKRLYFWVIYETDLEGYDELCSFWDDIELADCSSYRDPKEIRQNMLEFLDDRKAC